MLFQKPPVMTLGDAALAAPGKRPQDDLWLGTANGEPIPWRLLSREGNGGRYQNAAGEPHTGPALLLVTQVLLGTRFQGGIEKNFDLRFYEEDTEPETEDPAALWRQSAACRWCGRFFEDCLSAPERDALLCTSKSDGEYTPVGWSSRSVPAAPGILEGDRVFFLSAQEAENEGYGFKNKQRYVEKHWWTRSYRGTRNYRGQAEIAAGITMGGGLQLAASDSRQYARPAVNLDASRVLFVTPVSGGWKLTLLDESRKDFAAGPAIQTGSVLTIPYRNARPCSPGWEERVSAIVAAPDGKVRHYQNLAAPEGPDGEAVLDLAPLKCKRGDRLFLFSERCRGDFFTDWASPLVEVAAGPFPVQ